MVWVKKKNVNEFTKDNDIYIFFFFYNFNLWTAAFFVSSFEKSINVIYWHGFLFDKIYTAVTNAVEKFERLH